MTEQASDAGWIFLTANHRLVAPCTGYDILSDIKSLFTWIKSTANGALSAHADARRNGLAIDSERLIVAGASAGGYMANLAGRWCEPRPKAVIALYAQGGDFLVRVMSLSLL